MNEKLVKLDVRDDIARGREPFSPIMLAVSNLRDDENLLLIAPFKPAPLFNLLAHQGFTHEENPLKNGAWEILFLRTPSKSAA